MRDLSDFQEGYVGALLDIKLLLTHNKFEKGRVVYTDDSLYNILMKMTKEIVDR